MSQNKEPNFMDARTIAAVALVGATFMGWQYYMSTKYPHLNQKKAAAEASTPVAAEGATAAPGAPAGAAVQADSSAAAMPAAPAVAQGEKLTRYESQNISFDISSKGMGIKNVHVLSFKDRTGQVIEIARPAAGNLSFETQLMGRNEALYFNVEKLGEHVFVGRASVGGVQVTKTMEIDPAKYTVEHKVAVTGSDDKFIGLTNFLTDEAHSPKDAQPHLPQYNLQELYVETADKSERVPFTEENDQQSWSRVKLASVGSHYFTQVLVDKSEIIPEGKTRVDHAGKFAEVQLSYPVLNKGQAFNISYSAFVGPKSFKLLENANPEFAKVVDFGFFNWIARKLLELLIYLHAWIGNWGWAIIALTILVRILVLPFNIYSYKSMKEMQAIQPQIQALREKYKDDQQKQQQEMMALMKSHKVNPVGGCLPVLLQIPIFIALYQVLGNSIELYQAPFALWIQDLSLKDPFYILPVLMGVTMFIQQKITPNTMDPAQAKIMLFLPLIFIFFMITLPSGLTLYMWVSAVFGVLQQMYFLRRHGPVAVPAKK